MTDSTELTLPPSAPPLNHGHTVAAWFLAIVVVVGAIVIGVALCLSSSAFVWVGAAIAVIGVVGGKVLALAGYGQERPTTA